MEEAIQSWQFADGHYYILPIYSNPILYGWRTDILAELGVTEIPSTYEEIIEVARIAQEEDIFLMVRPALVQPNWWERWFDFFTLYNSISGNQPFIEDAEITADEDAVLDVFRFYQQLAAEPDPAGVLMHSRECLSGQSQTMDLPRLANSIQRWCT